MLKFLSLFEPKCMEWYCIKPEVVMNTLQTCWYCCSVTKLCPALFDLMDCSTPGFLYTSLSPRVCSNSCPLSWWYHPIISSSVAPFSCPQSFGASGSFPVSWFFAASGQSIGASALASVLPMNIQGWFPLGFTGLTSLLSKGRSRVFSSTKVQKHQFFSTQPSSWFNPHILTWLLEKL